jgi:hypothetical protein
LGIQSKFSSHGVSPIKQRRLKEPATSSVSDSAKSPALGGAHFVRRR